jgi:hypothetical protein
MVYFLLAEYQIWKGEPYECRRFESKVEGTAPSEGYAGIRTCQFGTV